MQNFTLVVLGVETALMAAHLGRTGEIPTLGFWVTAIGLTFAGLCLYMRRYVDFSQYWAEYDEDDIYLYGTPDLPHLAGITAGLVVATMGLAITALP